MKAYVQLTLSQLLIFTRNRGLIFFSLLFPILLMVALGSFIGKGTSTSFELAVVNQDQSEASQVWLEQLSQKQGMKTVILTDKESAIKAVQNGEHQALLVIPSGYGDALNTIQQQSESAPSLQEGSSAITTTAAVELYYDTNNQTLLQGGLDAVSQLADSLSKEIIHYEPVVTVNTNAIQAVELTYINFLVPGIVAMMIMNSNLNGVAGQIASWRERGILRRMQSTTLHPSSFIAAQITARLMMNGLQAIILLLVAFLFFGTEVRGSWLLLIFFVVLGTLTFMSIGFIIASLAKSPEMAGPIAGLISFPLLFLGNVFFPIDNMPEFLQPFVKAIPITHLSEAMRAVMNVGADLSTLWLETLVLGAWMIAAFLIATFTFKWK